MKPFARTIHNPKAKKKSLIAIGLLVLTSCGIPGTTVRTTNEDDKRKRSIALSELHNSYVIGRLGNPLGTIVTIEGEIEADSTIRSKAEQGKTLLRVRVVNSQRIDTEQVIQLSGYPDRLSSKPGQKFKFIGYETGSFIGTPRDSNKYINSISAPEFHFTTVFEFLTTPSDTSSSTQ